MHTAHIIQRVRKLAQEVWQLSRNIQPFGHLEYEELHDSLANIFSCVAYIIRH